MTIGQTRESVYHCPLSRKVYEERPITTRPDGSMLRRAATGPNDLLYRCRSTISGLTANREPFTG